MPLWAPYLWMPLHSKDWVSWTLHGWNIWLWIEKAIYFEAIKNEARRHDQSTCSFSLSSQSVTLKNMWWIVCNVEITLYEANTSIAWFLYTSIPWVLWFLKTWIAWFLNSWILWFLNTLIPCPLRRGLHAFLHFIQIYIGYEFSSIEKKVTCIFLLHSLHPNRHRLWVFCPLGRGLHLFSPIHFIQIDIGYKFFVHWEEGYMLLCTSSKYKWVMNFHPLRRSLHVFSSIHHPNRHRLWVFCPLRRGLHLFPSIHFIQIDIGYKFLSIEKRATCFLHFIQIYMGYEFSSIEKKLYMFFSSIHFIQIHIGYFEINLDQSQFNTLCIITLEVLSLPFQASFEACDHLLKDSSISNKCWIYFWQYV
jgi:hypothetical protein